jgi:hypothetical protein
MYREPIQQALDRQNQATQCNRRVQADWEVTSAPQSISAEFIVTQRSPEDSLTSGSVAFVVLGAQHEVKQVLGGATVGPTSRGTAGHGLQGSAGIFPGCVPRVPGGTLEVLLAGTVSGPEGGCTFLFRKPFRPAS